MTHTLHSEILQCLANGDLAAAREKIEHASRLRYPEALIASWQNLLEAKIQKQPQRTTSLYPAQLDRMLSNQDSGDMLPITASLRTEIFHTWKAALSTRKEAPPTDTALQSAIDRILAAAPSDGSEVLLPEFETVPLFFPGSVYSQISYLEDNPDLERALGSSALPSWSEHLLRHGIPEIIQGLRTSRFLVTPQASPDCTILHLVDPHETTDALRAADSLLKTHPTFNPFQVIYDCANAQFYQANRPVETGEIFSAIAKIRGPLLIRRAPGLLDQPLYGWFVHRSLDPNQAFYGCWHHLDGQPFSPNDALLGDIVGGQLLCNPSRFFSVFDQLLPFKSSQGFLCALCSALYRSGVHFHYTQDSWSRLPAQPLTQTPSSWSPFYSPRDVRACQLISRAAADWRKDQLIHWQQHLEALGTRSQWQVHNDVLHTAEAAMETVTVLLPLLEPAAHLVACVSALFERREQISIQVMALCQGHLDDTTRGAIDQLLLSYPGRFCVKEAVAENQPPSTRARLLNQAAAAAESSTLLLLHPDVILRSDNALTNLLLHHLFFHSLATGALLYDQSGFIQHNGFALNPLRSMVVASPTKGKKPGINLALDLPQSATSRLYRTHECSAVSTACLLIRKQDFDHVQGLDPNLSEPYADVDFCLRLKQAFPGRPCICVTDHLIVQHTLHSANDANNTITQAMKSAADQEHLIQKHPQILQQLDPLFEKILRPHSLVLDKPVPLITPGDSPLIDLSTLYFSENKRLPEKRIASIFVHYDDFGDLSKNCQRYLQALHHHTTLFFVSSSAALLTNRAALDWLNQWCAHVVVRKNSGYDFGSWSHMIQTNYERLCQFDGVLLVNDSVIGPLRDLDEIFHTLSSLQDDFAGLTASLTPTWHLQSYFIYYRQPLVRSLIFKQHWQHIRALPSKWAYISHYEIGWSSLLKRLNHTGGALFDAFTLADNPVHMCWDGLLEAGFPFLKRELLRDNPCRRDLSRLPGLLKQLGSDLEL